jgi:hypothetical protein
MWVSTGLTLIVAGLALAMVRGAGKTQPGKLPPSARGKKWAS